MSKMPAYYELEATLQEVVKVAPTIRKMLDGLPELQRLVALAKAFREGVDAPAIENKGQNHGTLPNRHAAVKPTNDAGLVKPIMRVMAEGDRTTPKEMVSILDKLGFKDLKKPKNKVPTSMYYLRNRGLLEGNGGEGYIITDKGKEYAAE